MLPLSQHLEKYVRIEDGYVLSEFDKIIEVGQFSTEVEERVLKLNSLKIIGLNGQSKQIPCLNGVLLPGFVKCHGHDAEASIVGLDKETTLTEWLDRCVNPFTGFLNANLQQLQQELGESPHLVTYRKARLDDLQFGITSAMAHHCNHNKYHVPELAQANLETGTKMDRFFDARILDTVEEALQRLDSNYELFKNAANTKIIPGPDQCFSNSPAMLTALKQWARDHGTLIHIHSSEEPATTAWFCKKFGETPMQYLNSINFLDSLTLVAHAVNLTPGDIQILAKTGTKVAHNPLANTVLSSGMPPIREFLESKIGFAVATDGSGSADSQNILAAVRLTEQFFRGKDKKPLLRAEQMIELITAVPAEFLQLNCGRLQKGMQADFVLIDCGKANMRPTHLENCVENVVWAAAGNEARWVVSNGVELVANYEYKNLGFDWRENLEQIGELTRRFLEWRKGQKGEISQTGVRSE